MKNNPAFHIAIVKSGLANSWMVLVKKFSNPTFFFVLYGPLGLLPECDGAECEWEEVPISWVRMGPQVGALSLKKLWSPACSCGPDGADANPGWKATCWFNRSHPSWNEVFSPWLLSWLRRFWKSQTLRLLTAWHFQKQRLGTEWHWDQWKNCRVADARFCRIHECS